MMQKVQLEKSRHNLHSGATHPLGRLHGAFREVSDSR